MAILADEILQDVLVLTSFKLELANAQGQKQIVINSDRSLTIQLTVTNTSTSEAITIVPFRAGTISEGQYHFELTFEQKTLSKLPTISQTNSDHQWTVAPFPSSPPPPAVPQSLYLGWVDSQATPITINPKESLTLELTYTKAVQTNHNDPHTKVSFWVGQNITVGSSPATGPRGEETLTLVADTAVPTAPPLSVDFVGPNAVLNDGYTSNKLLFALTNMIGNDLPIRPKTGDDDGAPTTFSIWFDDAPNGTKSGYEWALAAVDQLDNIEFDASSPSGWNIPGQPNNHGTGDNPKWSLTSTETSLSPETPVVFTLTNIISDLPSGVCRMYLQYENLPGYPPGILVANIEKSSLLQGPNTGDGLYLQVGPVSQAQTPDFGNGLYINQAGTGAAAKFDGALLVDATAANQGDQAAVNISANSDSQPALAVQQNGKASAAKLDGALLVDATAANQVDQAAVNISAQSDSQPALAVQQNGKASAAWFWGNSNISTALSIVQQGKAPAATLVGALQVDVTAANQGDLAAAQISGQSDSQPALSIVQNGSGLAANLAGALVVDATAANQGDQAAVKISAKSDSQPALLLDQSGKGSTAVFWGNSNISTVLFIGQLGKAPAANLLGALQVDARAANQGDQAAVNIFANSNAPGLVVYQSGSASGMTIVAPNTTSPGHALEVHGTCINSSGYWRQYADMNLKERVQPFNDGLAHVLHIEPIRYRYKEETGLGSIDEHVGVSAQELEEIAPYMVGTAKLKPDSDEEHLCIDNGPLTYMLINAVKELHSEIETMKTEIEALKKRCAA